MSGAPKVSPIFAQKAQKSLNRLLKSYLSRHRRRHTARVEHGVTPTLRHAPRQPAHGREHALELVVLAQAVRAHAEHGAHAERVGVGVRAPGRAAGGGERVGAAGAGRRGREGGEVLAGTTTGSLKNPND